MAELNKSQKETLRQLAIAIAKTASWPKETFESTFQCTKEQAHLNQATLLKHFAETN